MKQRVLTALALAPVVLGALFLANPAPLLALAVLVATLCGDEIARLLGGQRILSAAVAGFLTLAYGMSIYPVWTPVIASLVGIACASVAMRKPNPILALPAVLWAIGPLCALLALHNTVTSDLWYFKTPVILAILPLWGGDTAAIFAGKAFGRHLLAPKISPKKTVEGSVANLIACIAVAAGIGALIDIPIPQALACGFAAGTLGQAGDLFESAAKRRAGLKDSGSLLPGHGGVMDRIDSILFTAPAVLAILLTFASRQ